jgi:hypothetical protein
MLPNAVTSGTNSIREAKGFFFFTLVCSAKSIGIQTDQLRSDKEGELYMFEQSRLWLLV